ncbi:MAG: protein kinase domain-containing protein, partial [Ilumatobacteraceae bacterium]
MLERCAHENIVRVHTLFRGPRDLALTLELIPGGDVQMMLQRHGALAESAACSIVRQLAMALRHVHSVGVLHRDVKLENLLVLRPVPSPLVKLCDFGHA